MGMFDTEEQGDIMYDSHDVQITDEPADVGRQRASSHRGAAYHDPYYPPHGASGGQEGGSMRPEQTIEIFGVGADVLFGKNYARGLDILGAVVLKKPTQRAGFVTKSTPGGRTIISIATNKPAPGDHVAVIKNSKDVGKRAIATGQKLLALASKAPAPRKVTAKPKVAVRGDDGFDLLGAIKRAVAPRGKVAAGSRKKRFTPAQAKKIGAQAVQAGKDAIAKGGKLDKLVKADAAKKSAGMKSVQAKMASARAASVAKTAATPAAATKAAAASKTLAKRSTMLGDACEVLGAYCDGLSEEIVGETQGEILGDRLADILIHGEHGHGRNDMKIYGEAGDLVTDGSPDDLMLGEDLVTEGDPNDTVFGNPYDGIVTDDYGNPIPDGTDPNAGLDYYTDAEAGSLLDTSAENDYGLGPAPTKESVLADYEKGGNFQVGPDITTDLTDYTVYKSLPKGAIAYDGNPGLSTNCIGSWSMIYGQTHNAGLIYGGQPAHWIEYLNVQAKDKKDPADFSDKSGPQGTWRQLSDQEFSLKKNYGPLVGNPGVPGFGGLRRGPEDTWFWFFNEAPDNKKSPIIDKLLAEAMTTYATNYANAKADAAARVLADLQSQKEYEDKLKQQAREDADTARRMTQEQAEAEHQASLQTTADTAEVASISQYEEGATAVEERRAQLDEERYARLAQLEDERAAREADRQAERDQRELENLAKLADQERESEARYPSADDGAQAQADAEEGGQAPEEQYYNPSGEPVMEHEEGPLPSVEDIFDQPDEEGIFGLFGNGRAIDRIRARIRARKAS